MKRKLNCGKGLIKLLIVSGTIYYYNKYNENLFNMKEKNFVAAVLAGAAAGTILGILFAPQKGKDTRDELLTDCNNWLDKIGTKKQTTEWDNEPVEEKAITNPYTDH